MRSEVKQGAVHTTEQRDDGGADFALGDQAGKGRGSDCLVTAHDREQMQRPALKPNIGLIRSAAADEADARALVASECQRRCIRSTEECDLEACRDLSARGCA